jgi:DNA-binding SARP family transcriptional activator
MLELRLLGPVEVSVDGERVALPAKPRALLALLALHANRPLPNDRLVDLLWDERPPDRAVKTLQVYVSQLRKALGPDRLATAGGGYALSLSEEELDVTRFERLVREGAEQVGRGDAAAGSETLTAALELWRGDPLADLGPESVWRDEAARLEELHCSALEERAEAGLALGRHAQLSAELERLVAARPERERPRAQLMLALYRSGRQEEALEVYRRTREDLVERLGIEPGPELRELHGRILRQDPELAVPPVRSEQPTTTAARRRRPRAVIAGLVALAVVGTGVGLAVALGGGGGSASQQQDPALEGYVLKLENFLGQSHDARRQIVATIAAARSCGMPPRRAAAAISRVERSRQSLLQQLAALAVPSQPAALRTFDLLQRAAQASITADWQYRDWLRARRRCVRGASPPATVLDSDARATRLKASFVAAFAPLARRFHAAEWRDADF